MEPKVIFGTGTASCTRNFMPAYPPGTMFLIDGIELNSWNCGMLRRKATAVEEDQPKRRVTKALAYHSRRQQSRGRRNGMLGTQSMPLNKRGNGKSVTREELEGGARGKGEVCGRRKQDTREEAKHLTTRISDSRPVSVSVFVSLSLSLSLWLKTSLHTGEHDHTYLTHTLVAF